MLTASALALEARIFIIVRKFIQYIMKKILIQRTVKSLIKNGIFLAIIALVVFACETATNDFTTSETTATQEPVANLRAKMDGAIMGSVIAPNADIVITANNSDKKITGTTNENGEFFITGFPAGTFTVEISSSKSDNVEVFDDVEVAIGEVTALGTVAMDQE